MNERVPADQAVRDAALAPERSFIVQAPAGSGKTELLTQRFLRLLATVERPEEIVAITFTRKAAGEMRDRILHALRRGEDATPPASSHERRGWALAREALARDAALGWGLAANPRRLRIETIDALNGWLARQLPVSSRLGAAPVISDDPEPAYRRAVRDILLSAGGDESYAPHAAALLRHLGGRFSQAESLLVAMLKARDHWLGKIVSPGGTEPARLRAVLDRALQHFVEDELHRANDAVPDELRGTLADALSGAAEHCLEAEVLQSWAGGSDFPAPVAEELPRWRALAGALLTKTGGWRKRLTKNEGFPPAAGAQKLLMEGVIETLATRDEPEVFQRVLALPEPVYDDTRWDILEHLLELLPVAAAALRVEFAVRGESDYVGIAQAALDALGEEQDPTDLALALDTRVSHLLVDEFQDTSQSQVDLLARLTAGWSPGDGRSLFCVGDPMQSIYRFREADVGRFIRAQRSGIGGLPLEPLRLTVNFRSQAGLVDWVSNTFPGIFPAREDMSLGAVTFSPSVAWQAELAGPAVTCTAVGHRDFAAEAAAVTQLVQRLQAAEPATRIAVLVRSRRHLARITPALRAAGIPCRAVEIEPLAEGPAIRDLEALTRALCHRADRTAWLAVLRAPWCGLQLADLLHVAGGPRDDVWERLGDASVLAGLAPAARERVARCVAALGPALASRGRRSLRQVVQGAWLALGGPATVERESELADAQSFFDFLEQRARHGDLDDPAALSEQLARLYAAPETVEDDAVELLTIHKAKGLEFDHVILPGLDRKTGGREKKLLRWLEQTREEGVELILAPLEPLGEESDPLHLALKSLDALRDRLELDRLLYVATTRPRRQLHLVAGIKPDDPDSEKAFEPERDSLLARLWEATGAAFLGSLQAAGGADAVPEPRPPAMLRRLADGWQPPPTPAAVQWTSTGEPPATAGTAVEYDWSGRQARAIGLAVHRLLQLIAVDGPALWPETRLRGRAALLRTLLAEAGLGPDEMAAALERCLAALWQTLQDPRGRWLLDPGHAEARSELALSGWIDGRLVNGIVDRSFVDEAGVRWIIDYKAGRHEGGELERFLDQEEERYRPQLERYARLVSAQHPGLIRLGLYFPQHAGWREWDPENA